MIRSHSQDLALFISKKLLPIVIQRLKNESSNTDTTDVILYKLLLDKQRIDTLLMGNAKKSGWI